MLDEVSSFCFKENGDDRGKLVAVEGKKDVPFAITRIFYIYGADNQSVRGLHANRRTEFVLINVSGTSKIRVTDGIREKIYTLSKPNVGIYLPKMIWKEMYDFSPDSVLLCLCSDLYDASEYIRDYNEYLKEVEYLNEKAVDCDSCILQ